MSRFGAEYEKIERGGIPSSTEERLAELLGWGGTTSFFSAQAVDVGADAGVHAVGQVVGLSAGYIRSGYVRTTHVGQGRLRVGVPRWREHSGPPASWAQLRGRALGRLTKQAGLLDADAVVGVQAERRFKRLAEPWAGEGEVVFSGTAVRVDRWRSRTEPPVLSLASVPELWAMLRAGVEPAGIAGGFAGVETLPSTATAMAAWGRRRRSPNIEFEDLTKSMYEARRLAIERLLAEAKGLKADGLVGVKLEVDDSLAQVRRVPNLRVTVHVLASAVRRVGAARLDVSPVVSMSGGAGG
jgi:uncharacterized protein YbjQ (UPF0145 family)